MAKQWKAHLAVFVANLLYGANYSIAKEVMPTFIPPFGFILIRVWIAAILFLITAQLFVKEKIQKEDRLRIFLCAVFGVAVNQLLFFKGLSLTSPINSGLMMVTNPVFVLMIPALFMGVKISGRSILGICLGLSGALLLIIFGSHYASNKESSSLGDLFILLNALSYAIYLIIVKPLMFKYHPITIMKVVFCWGAIMVLPFGIEQFTTIQWHTFETSTWLATAFVVIGTTYFAYLFNTLALRELSSNVVSVYIYLQPLLAAGFAMLLGKGSPNLIHLMAAVLIFSGVYLSTTSGNKSKEEVSQA
ncbi:DMT family transporter [soil metagenome]